MAINTRHRGFALYVAVIVMSVMLTFGLSLGSLAYKQLVLASGATESQYAFYAADAALECALYADQRLNLFDYATHNEVTKPDLISPGYACNGPTMAASEEFYSYSPGSQLVMKQRITLSSRLCADVTIYKPAAGGTTYIYSQGYNVSCATVALGGARIVSRGINAEY